MAPQDMKAWEALSKQEYDDVWDRFYAKFVSPNGRINDFLVPATAITYSIDAYFCGDESKAEVLENDLHHKTRLALQGITDAEDYFYALDWQHDGYRFYPHGNFAFDDSMAWEISLIPNGDYHFFLNKTLTVGLLGHPWKQTISILGDTLITALAQLRPTLFDGNMLGTSKTV